MYVYNVKDYSYQKVCLLTAASKFPVSTNVGVRVTLLRRWTERRTYAMKTGWLRSPNSEAENGESQLQNKRDRLTTLYVNNEANGEASTPRIEVKNYFWRK